MSSIVIKLPVLFRRNSKMLLNAIFLNYTNPMTMLTDPDFYDKVRLDYISNFGELLESGIKDYERSGEYASHIMESVLDPHTSGELDIDSIKKMVDELIEAHGSYMPEYH